MKLARLFLILLASIIPIEYRYDKPLRHFSLTLIPDGLIVPPNYSKKIFFYPSDLIALSLLLIALFWIRVPLRKFFADPLWILFLCATASIIASPLFNYPIPYIRLLQLLTPIILFSFLKTGIPEQEKEPITRSILIAFLSMALFQAGVGIAQYFLQKPLGLTLLSETSGFPAFLSPDGSRWIFDSSKAFAHLIRAKGTMPHSNPYGALLFVSLLFTYLLILKFPQKKGTLALTLPIQFFAQALSFSRASFFALLIATLIWFAFMFKQRGLKDPLLRFIAFTLLASALATGGLIGKQIFLRGGIVNYNEMNKKGDQGRIILQQTAINIIKDQPLLGLGYSQFSNRSEPYFPPNTPPKVKLTAPHNIFLFLASETGLISLGAFLLSLSFLLWRLIKTPLAAETITFGALFIGFLFIGGCDFYPIFYQQGKLIFFLVLGLVALHSKVCYKRAPQPEALHV